MSGLSHIYQENKFSRVIITSIIAILKFNF